MKIRSFLWMAFLLFVANETFAADVHKWGLERGNPEIQTIDRLTFGPEGIVIFGDSKGANLFAIDTGDKSGDPAKAKYDTADIEAALKKTTGAKNVVVNDLAVNPLSGNIYFALAADAKPAIVRIDSSGKWGQLEFKNVPFLRAALPNPPEDKVTGEGPRARNRRGETITDLAYVDGKVLVSGMTSNAAPSAVREIPFPFMSPDSGAQIEIFHAAHGKVEDYAAIRTFVPLNIDGKPALLAGFTCTPLVRFSIEDLDAGKKVRGTTVAELGNRNVPLDMIAYEKNGANYLLLANSARGVMKIDTKNIGRSEGLTQPVSGGGTAGQSFETLKQYEGTVQLDRLNATQAVLLLKSEAGLKLQSVDLP